MSKKRKILGIFRKNKDSEKKEYNENSKTKKLKKSDRAGVLGTVDRILSDGKNKIFNLDRNTEHDLSDNVLKEIKIQVNRFFNSMNDSNENKEEVEIVTSIMKKLYTNKGRIPDCISIANYLNFDNERVENFLLNYDKLQNDSVFSKNSIDENVRLLLILYGKIEGLNEIPDERFNLNNEEINSIVNAIKVQKDLATIYEIFMYLKYLEINNQFYDDKRDVDEKVANTPVEQLDFLIRTANHYECSLEDVWHVFGINTDNKNLQRESNVNTINNLPKSIEEFYIKHFEETDHINNEIEMVRKRTEAQNSEQSDIALRGRISKYIKDLKNDRLRNYEYITSGKPGLNFVKSEIEEFTTAVNRWLEKNNKKPSQIDVIKAYDYFYEHTQQTEDGLDNMKFLDIWKKRSDINKKITTMSENVKAHPRISIIAGGFIVIGGVMVFNLGKGILENSSNDKVLKTGNTIKIGETTLPVTIEPGFLESLYKDPEEIPENTPAIIYPNGNVQLITKNGVKNISNSQIIKYQINEIKMGVTDSNAEVILRDRQGNPLTNSNNEEIYLFKNSEVIILPEVVKNKHLVIETKTGKKGYVFVGDVVEKTINSQEFEIGGENPTYYIVKTRDIVYIRETPAAGDDYKGNIKGTIGSSESEEYYLAVKFDEKFYELPMFGDESAYIPEDEVEIAYIIQNDGLKELEKEQDEQEKYNYDDNQEFEIDKDKFAIGYTTQPYTIEEGLFNISKKEISEGSYIVQTSKTTEVITSDGEVHKINGTLEDENSDKAKMGIQYLRTGIVSGTGEGVPLLNENGEIKQDKNGKKIMLSEQERVVVSPKGKVKDKFHIMRTDGTTGYTSKITDLRLLENDMKETQIIAVNKEVPLLTTPYYAPKTDYADNHLKNKKGEEVTLKPGKKYIAQKDEETGFWIVTDNQFTYQGKLYLPEENIDWIYTVKENGIEKDKLVHEDLNEDIDNKENKEER